ncbi:MAG: hypothetical protein ACPG47_08310 [Leucothrix sp.]
MITYSRNTKRRLTHPVVSFALCGLLLAGCSNNDDDVSTVPPNASSFAKNTMLSVQVFDTNGDPVEGATVSITSDPDDIVPANEESLVTESAPAGLVIYAPNEFTGTKSLQILASKDGFLSNNIPVDVVGGDLNEASIIITDITANTTAGINTATETGDISQNPLTSSAQEGDGSNDNSKTTVTVPIDPGATTANGTPLGNNLSLVVAQYDPDQPQSLDAFPGGLTATIGNPAALVNSGNASTDGVTPSNGDVIFQSAGFTAIEVKDDQGNVAKNFNKPVEVSTKVDSAFVNPMTGAAIVAGDTIPIWSYEASTGQWNYEKTGTVVADANGGLKVDYTVSHLSYYNLDYYGGGRCNSTVTFQDTNGSTVGSLYGRLTSPGWSRRFSHRDNNALNFRNAPVDRMVRFTNLRSRFTNQPINVISPTGPINLCNPSTHTVIVDVPVIQYSELTVGASLYCSNNSAVPEVPIAGAYTWVFTSNWRFVGFGRTNGSGQKVFNLPAGSYQVFIYDRINRRYTRQNAVVTASANGTANLRVPQVCPITTGGSN